MVIHIDAIDTDDLPITVQRGATVVGVAHARTSAAPTARARLELDGHGEIPFIPTNRDAEVLPAGLEGATLVPVPVDGVYTVSHDASGGYSIRGAEGTAGSVALRLAYRDHSLPVSLRDTDLALLTEPVDRTIHVANMPIPIGASAESNTPFVELMCGPKPPHPPHPPPAPLNLPPPSPTPPPPPPPPG